MKRFALLMAGLMSLGVLSSCGSKSSSYDSDNFLSSGDKIVKDKIELTFFAPLHPLHASGGYNEMKLFKKMEEITNIHINWVYGSTSSYDELRATAWQSKDKPDAFFLWNPINEVVNYGDSGLIYDLTDTIAQYAPNYTSILSSHPEWKKKAAFDGKMYSFLSINDVPRDQTFKQFINQKWLDALDLDMPKTVEEYRDVLRAFKNDDPNGNGIPDEIPLSSAKLYQTRNFLMSAFGYVSTGVEADDNGNIIYVPATDNYRAYLEYAHSLYAEGLLDNNTYVMSDSDLLAKGENLGSFDGAAAYLVAGTKKDADYTACPALTSSINNKQMWLGFNTVLPSALIVTKNSPYVKEIVRWMDFLYSPLGIQLQAFGEEGVDFTWDDEEKTSFTFNVPDGMAIEEFRGTLTPGVGLGQVAYWDKDIVLKDNNEYTSRINKEVDEAKYMDYLKIPMPELAFTQEELSKKAIVESDLSIYMDVFEQKCVTGKTEINDETWAAHLANLSKIKVDDLIEVYKSAYARQEG